MAKKTARMLCTLLASVMTLASFGSYVPGAGAEEGESPFVQSDVQTVLNNLSEDDTVMIDGDAVYPVEDELLETPPQETARPEETQAPEETQKPEDEPAEENAPDQAFPALELTAAEAGQLSEEERIQYAVDQLERLGLGGDTPKVTFTNLDFPSSIQLPDKTAVEVSWTSNDPEWISDQGELLREAADNQPVSVTATVGGSRTVPVDIILTPPSNPKAYPGAEGYGTQTRGGAGGYVVHVTSLAAEGPGTLKEAMENKVGKRTIVFDVGGTIDLTPLGRALGLRNEAGSNVTIAGQTAPGEGIQLKGYGITLGNVHDVIIRHLSIRIGNVRKAGDTYQSDPLSVTGGNRRVVLDHLSMSWGVDMGFRVYGQEVTMSNCMVSKGLYWNTPHEKGAHNYAGMFGPKYGSFYNNYLADCGQRSPRIVDNEYVDVRNNVVSNSKYTFDICNYEWQGANAKYNVVNNMVLYGNPGPAGKTGNSSTGGSYKYFQGRTYSGGLFAYSVNNLDNTKQARPDLDDGLVEGGLWQGSLDGADQTKVENELGVYSQTGYSNMTEEWHNMVLPEDISIEDYDASDISKKGNTLLNYPLPVPDMTTRDPEEAVKHVLANAGAASPVRGILDNALLAEGRTRLGIHYDYSKVSGTYGINLGETSRTEAYGLPVQIHTIYKDTYGSLVYDVDGEKVPDPAGYEIVSQYGFVSEETHRNTLYAQDLSDHKYRVVLRDYQPGDGIYDAFDIFDINNNKLTKPSPYVSSDEGTSGLAYKDTTGKVITLRYAEWGDGPGNYQHDTQTEDGMINGTTTDMEWADEDWPQLPEVRREEDFDSNNDGIPDFYVRLRGWTDGTNISYLDFDGNGYTNLEEYINDYCAGDRETTAEVQIEPVVPENIRDGSDKNNTHRSHEILFNTVRRAKAKIYYCEGGAFDMAQAKELPLKKLSNGVGADGAYNSASDDFNKDNEKYINPETFDTYFSAVLPAVADPTDITTGLKPGTTYSYKIKTYSDTGVEYLTPETYQFTTEQAPNSTPMQPRILKYVPFDRQITLTFEPGAPEKSYQQSRFNYRNWVKDESKYRRLTRISASQYDSSVDHYVLRVSTDPSFPAAATKEVNISANMNKYTVTDLVNDTNYYLDLRAVGANGVQSEPAVYNNKKAELLPEVDSEGNPVYGVKKIQLQGDKVKEYFYDTPLCEIPVAPSVYVIDEDYTKTLVENGIQEGETAKFTTLYGDVKDWYIYTLGGIPIPSVWDGQLMLMLRDESHEHGFTYAKKFSTPLTGKSTIKAKLMIHNEQLDPMSQAPEFRFYLQQDSAEMEDTDTDVDTSDVGTDKEAASFGNIVQLQFTKNEIIYNGSRSLYEYKNDEWYDIEMLMDGNKGTFSLYINDALVAKDLEYSESRTSNTIARWQLGSRLAGKEDVYIKEMYAYSGWDETANPPDEVKPAPRPNGGGGGGGGGGDTKPSPTPEATVSPEPTVTPKPVKKKAEFQDLKGYEWAEEAIEALAEREIVNGVAEGKFGPEGTLTRAQYVTMLVRAFDLKAQDMVPGFSDVEEGAWYAEAVKTAASCGIASGYTDGSFGVNDPITRQDLVVLSKRLADYKNLNIPKTEQAVFSDEEAIAEYARSAVVEFAAAGIVNGMEDGGFEPLGTANRAQAAKILYQLLELEQ